QTLLEGEAQRRILDAFAGSVGESDAVRDAYETLARVRREIADLSRRRAEAEKRADYLRHVVQEIEGARLTELEDVRLEEEARRRRDLLFRLTKKYGPTLTDVAAAGRTARQELDLVDSAALDLRTLEERERSAAATLHERASALTSLRRQAADRLARAVDD